MFFMRFVDALTYFGAPPPFAKQRVSKEVTLPGCLRRCGVSSALTLSTTGIFYDYREGNEETIEFVASEKSVRLIAVGTVDLRKYIGGEVPRLRERGFRALRLPNSLQGWGFDYAPFLVALSEAEGVRLPLIVDCTGGGTFSSLAHHAQGSKVPILATHVHYTNLAEAICVSRILPNLYFIIDHLNGPDSLEILVSEVGVERVVFGTGAPFAQIEPTKLVLESSKLSPEEKEAIAHGNISRLLESEEG